MKRIFAVLTFTALLFSSAWAHAGAAALLLAEAPRQPLPGGKNTVDDDELVPGIISLTPSEVNALILPRPGPNQTAGLAKPGTIHPCRDRESLGTALLWV